jgi:hypothetical protein
MPNAVLKPWQVDCPLLHRIAGNEELVLDNETGILGSENVESAHCAAEPPD